MSMVKASSYPNLPIRLRHLPRSAGEGRDGDMMNEENREKHW